MKELPEKKITKTYRRGKSVHQLEFVVRVKANIAETEFTVTERRAAFKDEKPIFAGSEKEAISFFDGISSIVYNNGVIVK